MVLSINRKLAELGSVLDSGTAGDFLTLNDSNLALFRNVLWTEIANRPNVLDSADISSLVSNVVDNLRFNAPLALDTLNELSAALNNDSNFAGTITRQINALPDSAQVSGIITSTVTQSFINALNPNATTLDGQADTYYLDYTNFTNTPAIGDSSAVATLIDKAYVDALKPDADTLDGQQGTYYLDYTNFTNTPNVLDSTDVNALVDSGIAALIDAAPAALDTLNELAAAINDDANFYTTITGQIAALPDSSQVSSIITADVDKAFVDALNVNADTLNSQQGTYYLDYTNFTNTPNVLDSANVLSIIDSAQISSVVDSAYIQGIVDSAYLSVRVTANSGFDTFVYTATQGQTTFADSDDNGDLLSYTSSESIFVFYNGILLLDSDDYAANGTNIVLTSGADSGDNIVVAQWAIASSGGSSFFLASAERALYAGGYGGFNIRNNMDYVTIATTGNATDFGDIAPSGISSHASVSDNTYALFAGGQSASGSGTILSSIRVSTIATTGNASSFGSLTAARVTLAGASDDTYGVFTGGSTNALYSPSSAIVNIMDYVTIATTGNASDYGDLTTTRFGMSGLGDGTYGIVAGGQINDWSGSVTNIIDYFTIASPGNATDFGDIWGNYSGTTGMCDGTYGIIAGGPNINVIQYITVQTPGNSIDFGDLTVNTSGMGAAGNATRGVFAGGRDWNTSGGDAQYNIIQYLTPSSPGNATDFGDLTLKRVGLSGCSGT